MKKLFIFLLIILSFILIFFMVKIRPTYFPFTTIRKPTEPKADTYIADLEFLNKVIKEHHPFLEVATATYKFDWDKEYSLAKEKVLTVTTTEDFEKIIEDLLSKLQNAHTLLMTDSDELAFSYYFYSNLGNKYDNHMIRKIRNPNTIAYYGLNNPQIKEFRKNGPQKFYDMRPYDNFSNKIIIPDKVAYAHVRTLLSQSDKEYYIKDVKKIDEFTKQCKDYPIFILDIRGNGGGNSLYWQDLLLPKLIENESSINYNVFLKDGFLYPESLKLYYKDINELNPDTKNSYFKNYDKNTMDIVNNFKLIRNSRISVWPSVEEHFTGKLYLLVDRNVYSSSEMLAAFCKETNAAILIGEKTGGDGIGSGVYLAVLPNSGLVIKFPINLGILENGSINEVDKTVPDYIVENATKDRKHNLWDYKQDPCINKIFELEGISIK